MKIMTTLCFRDRSWSEVELPFLEDNGILDDKLRTHGYRCVDTLGSEDGLHVEIWEHAEDGWLAIYSTRDSWYPIKIDRIQDLIDFTAHVAPSILVAVIPSDAGRILSELCDRSAWRQEQRQEQRRQEEEEYRRAGAEAKAPVGGPTS